MSSIIDVRKKKYEDLAGYDQELSKDGLAYIYNVMPESDRNLKESVLGYINGTLEAYYHREFNISNDDELHENIDKILGLPNVTPNGALVPKNETAYLTNDIQKSLIDYLEEIDILRYVKSLETVNVLIKSYTEVDKFSHRPYYTGKIHTDAWVGHHSDGIVWLGILGVGDDNTMEIFEPINPSNNFLTISQDFDEALKRCNGVKSLGKMSNHKMILMDHICLHQTYYTPSAKTRVTINCGIIMNNPYSYEHSAEKIERFNLAFYPINTLREIGRTLSFHVEESLKEAEDKFKPGVDSQKILPNNGIVIKEI